MEEVSYRLVERALGRVEWPEALCLDVGSLYVNGSYRPLVEERGWHYVGLDIVPGANVDVVAEQFQYPFADQAFDAVISGCAMEHVTAIWKWVPELVRLLRPGGLLAIVSHTRFGEHRYPVDCWRIMPDGMRYLFFLTGVLERCEIVTDQTDILGSAFRRSTDHPVEGKGIA